MIHRMKGMDTMESFGVAPGQRILKSFFGGGFECSTHKRRSGQRLDLIAAVRRHCACADVRGGNSPVGVMHEVCAPHDLLGQEPILKRLVFYRRWHRSRRE